MWPLVLSLWRRCSHSRATRQYWDPPVSWDHWDFRQGLLIIKALRENTAARSSCLFRAFPVWTPCVKHSFVAGERPSGNGDFLLDFTVWVCRSYHSYQPSVSRGWVLPAHDSSRREQSQLTEKHHVGLCCSVQFPGIRGSTPGFGNSWPLCILRLKYKHHLFINTLGVSHSVYWSNPPPSNSFRIHLTHFPTHPTLTLLSCHPHPPLSSVCFPKTRASNLPWRVVALPGVT